MKVIVVKEIDLFFDSLTRPMLEVAMAEGAKIQIHFCPGSISTWTMPKVITQTLIEDILQDHSIDQIKILEGIRKIWK